jgi:hypothetical protein
MRDAIDQLSVERLLPRFELALFTGSGFSPNTEVSFDSQSYDDKRPIKAKTDSEGSLQFALMPFVSGRNKGPPLLGLSERIAPLPLSLTGDTSSA